MGKVKFNKELFNKIYIDLANDEYSSEDMDNLVKDVVMNNSAMDIAKELMYHKIQLKPLEEEKIVINPLQKMMLLSMFKIKGEKIVDFEVVKDNRGGDRKSKKFKEDSTDIKVK